METRSGKGMILLRAALASLAFSALLFIDKLLAIGNILFDLGWPTPLILLGVTLVRMALAGIAVLAVLPPILGFKGPRDWLPGYLRIDLKVRTLGHSLLRLFALLAALISLTMGIFQGDLSIVFARPDTRPDPDVVGWRASSGAGSGHLGKIAFRGLILSKLRIGFRAATAILISAALFGLFHLTNLVTQPPALALSGVIMAFFFGIGWGVMTVRARSVIPAMIAHYLVDTVGQVFLGVDAANPAMLTGFFLLLTLTYPLFSIISAKLMYRDTPSTALAVEAGQAQAMSYDSL